MSQLPNGLMASRIVAAVTVLGLVSTAVFGSPYVSDRDEARWAGIAPPAQDALTQSLDLDRTDKMGSPLAVLPIRRQLPTVRFFQP